MLRRIVAVILAGGKGTRLEPLTRDRAKPAVPFGGAYRIIDFTLSNCINSGLRRILALTQYKARSLERHIQVGWNFLSRALDEYLDVFPPEQRMSEQWYQGTADALYQNIYSLERANPELVLVLSGDHIYKMDYSKLIDLHLQSKAHVSIACLPVPITECHHFGIVQADNKDRITGFIEKPATTSELPEDPGRCLASMGIYVFHAKTLYELLCEDAVDPASSHDFGKDILPRIVGTHHVQAYRFLDPETNGPAYWRDVGTLDAYYEANIDLVSPAPSLNLYERAWPIRSWSPSLPPAKFVHAEPSLGLESRRGEAINSMVGLGSIVSGGHVFRSVLFSNVRVNSYSLVEDSIILDGVKIGRHCRIRKAIIDKNVVIPPGTTLGFDHAEDVRRGFTITEAGVVVVQKGEVEEAFR